MMKKKLTTFALVGLLALGSTGAVFAATNPTTNQITPNTGVSATARESNESEDQELTAANTKTAISEEQAKQAALDAVKGGTFVSIEIEDEDGVIVYGVEIQAGTTTNDVKVDANTGTILKTDQGNDSTEKKDAEESTNDNDNDNIEHDNQNDDPAGYED